MAEKAIRLGGESTADAIVSAVDSLYPEHTFEDKEFALKHNDDEIAVDTNFAAQSFWKDAILRFFGKRSAVLGLILIVVIVLLAESKGISGPALIFRHALRNALIPIITVLAPLIVDLMTGSLVVEKIFAIPGVGSLLVTAIQSNDYNVVIGLSFIYSAMYIGIMLVVDLLYGIIDPRIRLAKGDD